MRCARHDPEPRGRSKRAILARVAESAAQSLIERHYIGVGEYQDRRPPSRGNLVETSSAFLLLQLLSDLLHLSPNPQQIAAPQLSDLLFGIASPHQFQRD